MGAFHTAEVPYWINHFSAARASWWSDVDYRLGDVMSDYLVNFATTGEANGATVPTWDAFDPTSEELAYLELGDEVVMESIDGKQAAFWKAYLARQ